MFKVMFDDFNTDLDNLIASKNLRKKQEPKITTAEFVSHFRQIHPWNDPREMDGPDLNIVKLLEVERDRMYEQGDPGYDHALVKHGYIDIFNLRVLGFLMCKGEYHYKAKALYKLLWDRKDALERNPMIGWS